MKKAVILEPGKVEIREIPDPDPKEDEILVRSTLSGLSVGTEMALYKGTIVNLSNGRWGYWNEYPIEMGYELVGTVLKAGKSISDLQEGDRVVAHTHHGTLGIVSFGQYVKIPDSVSDESATLAILGATTTHGMRRAKVEYGERILVLGLGVVGLLSAFHARRAGVDQVLVADPLEWKRKLAVKIGFIHTLDPLSKDFKEKLLDLTEGLGADLVIEASGHPSAIDPAFQAVKVGGRLLIQGTHTTPVPIVFSDYIMHKEITLIGTWATGTNLPTDPQYIRWNVLKNLELSMSLIERGELPVQGLITHRFPFEDLPKVYQQLANNELDYLQIILNY